MTRNRSMVTAAAAGKTPREGLKCKTGLGPRVPPHSPPLGKQGCGSPREQAGVSMAPWGYVQRRAHLPRNHFRPFADRCTGVCRTGYMHVLEFTQDSTIVKGQSQQGEVWPVYP